MRVPRDSANVSASDRARLGGRPRRLVTVVANAVRVAGTGVLAHKVDPSWAQGASHTTAGLVVFAIGLALLLGLDWLLKPAAPAAGDDAVRAA